MQIDKLYSKTLNTIVGVIKIKDNYSYSLKNILELKDSTTLSEVVDNKNIQIRIFSDRKMGIIFTYELTYDTETLFINEEFIFVDSIPPMLT